MFTEQADPPAGANAFAAIAGCGIRGGKIMLYLIIITIFFGALLYFIAAKRHADRTFWMIMGLLFGPLAIPFVFMAKQKY